MGKEFLNPEKRFSSWSTSQFVVVPCPHEASTSYGKGTKHGPGAIIEASKYLEAFDEELHFETYKKAGINTAKPTKISNLSRLALKIFKSKKIPIVLGGEHSISPEVIGAAKAVYPNLSVLQLDSHADLRDSYEGSKKSHACSARRMLEICPLVQVGIRNISREGFEFAKKTGQIEKIHSAEHFDLVEKVINQLSSTVYITCDVDVFDPSIMPATGTPEPGGLFWYEVLEIIREVSKQRKIIGADFVELSPIKNFRAPDFTIAKLVYKTIGYISR